MVTVHYTRPTGLCRTYEVTYDYWSYQIRFEGELRKHGALPQLVQGAPLTREEQAGLGLAWAKRDIDGLVGMDE